MFSCCLLSTVSIIYSYSLEFIRGISKSRNTNKRAAAPQHATTNHGDRGARGSSGSCSANGPGGCRIFAKILLFCACVRDRAKLRPNLETTSLWRKNTLFLSRPVIPTLSICMYHYCCAVYVAHRLKGCEAGRKHGTVNRRRLTGATQWLCIGIFLRLKLCPVDCYIYLIGRRVDSLVLFYPIDASRTSCA